MRKAILIAAVLVLAGASQVGLVHLGHPEAMWLWCDMLGWCAA
jgi:hypothetical protein